MPGQVPQILVVDDDPRWRSMVAGILTEAGYAVTVAAEPPADLRRYQLAVLDVALDAAAPDNRAGLDLLARLPADTPVIYFSGMALAELSEATADRPNVIGLISKDSFRQETLLELTGRALVRPEPAPGRVGEGPQVLIVEDDAQWRRVYESILGEAGYRFQAAVSYGEARGLLQREKFTLAIVDLHLVSSAAPEENRDGYWLLKAARQRGVPTIVVSALGAPEDIDRAYDEFGVFAFVEKEAFDRRAFGRVVAEAIQAAVPAAPAAADDLPADLTEREREVLALLAQGNTNRQIAETLLITPNTVKKHVDHILQKLNVNTRAAAAAIAVRAGLGK